MGTLTEEEVKQVIRRASILQKYHEQYSGTNKTEHPNEEILEIGDSIGIKRHFIQEALFELTGTPTEDPIQVDTGNNYLAEVKAYANGSIDSALLNELRAQIEYHFDTIGTISRRKGNVYWNAKPNFPRKIFEISSSPEVEFSEQKGRVTLKVTQSLKTINKFYAPAFIAMLGAFLMIAGLMFNTGSNDTAPFIIFSGIFSVFSFFYSRFITNKKLKRKKKLVELSETLQQIIERRFQAGKKSKREAPTISMDELDDLNETDEINVSQRTKANS